MEVNIELTPRELEVLSIVVEGYIEYATPIGSRYVARASNLNLSPATMRNIMADLTDKGYLEQPHTSAGRIPTKKGLKFYVNNVLRPSPLSKEKRKIREYFKHSKGYEFSHVLERTSKFISQETRLLGMVVAPQISFMKWKQVDFVLVRPGLVMAILVFEGGIVHNRLVSYEDLNITSNDLIKFSNYLNDKFKGKTLFEAKKSILKEMEDVRNKFNVLYFNALSIARQMCDTEEKREVYVEGTFKVIDHIDPKDVDQMKSLLEFLEKRSALLKLIEKLGDGEGIFITFANEVFDSDLDKFSIISSPYGVRGEPLGIIGTIGPIHMDYSKLIPMVDYVAKMLSEILENRY